MEIKGGKVMVLGGYGEVGFAICRRLLQEGPKELIITSLRKEEALGAVEKLRTQPPSICKLTPVYGNLFVRFSLKDIPREEIMTSPQYQQWLAEDALKELNEEILTSSTLFRVISEHSPEIIVDCINTATGLAYQNIYQSYTEISRALQNPQDVQGLTHGVYRLLSTLHIPPLVRHVQILYEAMKRVGTLFYLKIGTTGTGGMGLNIPFTHGEEQPSRLLLSKTAVAGAQTLLLFLLSRTSGGPIVKELKPAALIGWKGIGKGRILKGGFPISLYDCPPSEGYRLTPGQFFSLKESKRGLREAGRDVEGVYIDTGENGLFSLDEFEVITALGLMEYITPEEIAQTALLEIEGVNTSKDVLGAIAGAVMGPTYRAGFLRQRVIKEAQGLGEDGVAYGLLGPRIAKLIFEVYLIKKCYGTLEDVIDSLPEEMCRALEKEVERDQRMRSGAISLGVPILLPDGDTLLFAKRLHPDKGWEEEGWRIDSETIEKWSTREWIDLRAQNMTLWRQRLREILQEAERSVEDKSSYVDCGGLSWLCNDKGKIIIDPGEVVGWILSKEGAKEQATFEKNPLLG